MIMAQAKTVTLHGSFEGSSLLFKNRKKTMQELQEYRDEISELSNISTGQLKSKLSNLKEVDDYLRLSPFLMKRFPKHIIQIYITNGNFFNNLLERLTDFPILRKKITILTFAEIYAKKDDQEILEQKLALLLLKLPNLSICDLSNNNSLGKKDIQQIVQQLTELIKQELENPSPFKVKKKIYQSENNSIQATTKTIQNIVHRNLKIFCIDREAELKLRFQIKNNKENDNPLDYQPIQRNQPSYVQLEKERKEERREAYYNNGIK
ncbi:hypothetical protein [Rickettsiales endosymbiont of Stachyamoeba lipophora]|uniref:hypothetical protein n=1 Tax=Rickettsiales endosymbiont of Stachyamoeba lipophora TaxID=2486578 RepID=UPI000F6452EA|nr:hypothetical protein [Rickettsiales endosymbiont of Stachyamoeba lipophora]AZL16254.1 hypothetical protein EF513_06905 [Rickettsiales endosymbiont of Stachyamoeba lipophora]